MTHRFANCIVATAAILVVCFVMVPGVSAQARPDLNGTWDHGRSGFVRTQTFADGSVCVLDCPQPANATAGSEGEKR